MKLIEMIGSIVWGDACGVANAVLNIRFVLV